MEALAVSSTVDGRPHLGCISAGLRRLHRARAKTLFYDITAHRPSRPYRPGRHRPDFHAQAILTAWKRRRAVLYTHMLQPSRHGRASVRSASAARRPPLYADDSAKIIERIFWSAPAVVGTRPAPRRAQPSTKHRRCIGVWRKVQRIPVRTSAKPSPATASARLRLCATPERYILQKVFAASGPRQYKYLDACAASRLRLLAPRSLFGILTPAPIAANCPASPRPRHRSRNTPRCCRQRAWQLPTASNCAPERTWATPPDAVFHDVSANFPLSSIVVTPANGFTDGVRRGHRMIIDAVIRCRTIYRRTLARRRLRPAPSLRPEGRHRRPPRRPPRARTPRRHRPGRHHLVSHCHERL